MSSRLPVIAGLLSGVVVAGALVALLLMAGPAPVIPAATPSAPVAASPGTSGTAATAAPAASGTPAAGTSASPAASGGSTAFHVGEAAPPLAVPQVGGGTIDLAALRGKPVWVNFMATYCPPCVDEFPLMNGFAARYAEDGLVVLAIDVREEEGEVAAFAQSLNATFPIGLDLDGSAQDAWDAIALPVHFWVDANGIIRHGSIGGIGPDEMAAGLRSIMPGVDVTP